MWLFPFTCVFYFMSLHVNELGEYFSRRANRRHSAKDGHGWAAVLANSEYYCISPIKGFVIMYENWFREDSKFLSPCVAINSAAKNCKQYSIKVKSSNSRANCRVVCLNTWTRSNVVQANLQVRIWNKMWSWESWSVNCDSNATHQRKIRFEPFTNVRGWWSRHDVRVRHAVQVRTDFAPYSVKCSKSVVFCFVEPRNWVVFIVDALVTFGC